MQCHREEPQQNSNKNAKKMFYFHGNFYMVGTGIENLMHLDAFLATIEASDQ